MSKRANIETLFHEIALGPHRVARLETPALSAEIENHSLENYGSRWMRHRLELHLFAEFDSADVVTFEGSKKRALRFLKRELYQDIIDDLIEIHKQCPVCAPAETDRLIIKLLDKLTQVQPT